MVNNIINHRRQNWHKICLCFKKTMPIQISYHTRHLSAQIRLLNVQHFQVLTGHYQKQLVTSHNRVVSGNHVLRSTVDGKTKVVQLLSTSLSSTAGSAVKSTVDSVHGS